VLPWVCSPLVQFLLVWHLTGKTSGWQTKVEQTPSPSCALAMAKPGSPHCAESPRLAVLSSQTVLEHLSWLKTLNGFFKAVVDRVALAITRRKPKLHVHPVVGNEVWCRAYQGATEFMQVVCWADVTHDDPKNNLAKTSTSRCATWE